MSPRLAWAAALACAVGAAAVWWGLSAPAAPNESALESAVSNAPVTQPLPQTDAVRPAPASAVPRGERTPPNYPDPEVQLAVTADQHLVVNAALLLAFNHYLIDQAGDGDKADLLAYLKAALPARAFDDAAPLVDHYVDYMQDHDRQLAIQMPGQATGQALDPARASAWLTQLDLLRQIHLGAVVTQAWYQNDDSQLHQALDELDARQQMASGGAAPSRVPVPHWSDPAAEAQHVQYLHGLVAQAATSFQALSVRGAQAARADDTMPSPIRSKP